MPPRHSSICPNDTLKLTEMGATPERAILHRPHATACPRTAWVGAEERPEFRSQSRLLTDIWGGLDDPVYLVEDPGRHQFNVIDGLVDPGSPLTEAILADPGR